MTADPGAQKRPPMGFILTALAVLALLGILLASSCRPRPAPIVERPDSLSDSASVDSNVTVPIDTTAPIETDSGTVQPDSFGGAQAQDTSQAEDTTCYACGPEVTAKDTLPQRRRLGAVSTSGMAVGLNHWPMEKWCDGPLNGTVRVADAKYVTASLRRARDCGMRIFIAPPRHNMTTNDENNGHFSLTRAKAQVDRLRQAIASDLSLVDAAIWFAMDEPNCSVCWGGRVVSASDVRAYLRYFHDRLPGRIAVRTTPQVLAEQYSGAASLVDVTWVVWNMNRGDQKAMYDKQGAIAARIGVRTVMAFGAADCRGNKTAPCTPSQIKTFGQKAVDHPSACATISWQYEGPTWSRSDIRAAWAWLASYARSKPTRNC